MVVREIAETDPQRLSILELSDTDYKATELKKIANLKHPRMIPETIKKCDASFVNTPSRTAGNKKYNNLN